MNELLTWLAVIMLALGVIANAVAVGRLIKAVDACSKLLLLVWLSR